MEIARLYQEAQASFVDLVRDLPDDDWSRPVPCTPGWSIRDVLSHVAGVADDTVHGRLDGVATEPWTAAQVERWRDASPDDLLARWASQVTHVAGVYEAVGQILPVFDCHTHEHDVRHALGRPGNRDHEILRAMAAGMQRSPIGRPLRVVGPDGEVVGEIDGAGEPIELEGVSTFDLVRSRLGRRSRDQVAGYRWSAAPTDAELDEWFMFGPADRAIDE